MFGRKKVTCPCCGVRFDFRNGYVVDGTMYCQKCGPAKAADARETRTGMRQTTGAMIAKITAGALFVFFGFIPPSGGWDFGYFLTALAIGGGLIAWGLFPYMKVQKAKREQLEAEKRAIDWEREQREAKEREKAEEWYRKHNAPKTCPACGATSRGDVCEYCGTRLTDAS